MEKILVGFDGSKGSERALNKAMNMLDQYGELILLAVVPSSKDKTFVDGEMYKKLKKKAKNLIYDVISNIGNREYDIKGIIEEGDPAEIIIDVSNRLDVDLIVLGSKGTSELGQYLIGSVANKVVQYAYKPVMVVR
ncbi:MAG: universal stress protein [Thermoplasmatales archaeon]|nr:MAG: universal stress protein [Thermoplasmatales archaeon]